MTSTLLFTKELEGLRADNDRLRKWVSDLQSGLYVNCVYCGHRYGPGQTTPVAMAEALKAHIRECPEHPLSHAVAALQATLPVLEAMRRILADAAAKQGMGGDGGPLLDQINAALAKAGAS